MDIAHLNNSSLHLQWKLAKKRFKLLKIWIKIIQFRAHFFVENEGG